MNYTQKKRGRGSFANTEKEKSKRRVCGFEKAGKLTCALGAKDNRHG